MPRPPINQHPVSDAPLPWWDDACERCDPETHEQPEDGFNFPCWGCRGAAMEKWEEENGGE